jgi:hypothetical protein
MGKKNEEKMHIFFAMHFVDPDPHWIRIQKLCGSGLRKNAVSRSGLNQSGSTTLILIEHLDVKVVRFKQN